MKFTTTTDIQYTVRLESFAVLHTYILVSVVIFMYTYDIHQADNCTVKYITSFLLRAVKPEPRKINSKEGLKLVVFELRLLSTG